MGAILNFNNWKRLNEQATQSPVKLNNEISALRAGDAVGMWALIKTYGGLEAVLDILADSGADRVLLASKIKEKFGNEHFGHAGDNKFPNVEEMLDAFEDETTWEKVKNLIPNDDTYTGGEHKDPEFFKKDSWKMTSGGIGGGETRDPKFKL